MILDVPGSANSVQMNNILGFKIIMVDHLWSLHMCVYNCIIYTTTCGIMQYRGPSGYGALSLAFHPLHMDVTRNTVNCHLQKLSDDTAIVRCVSEGTNDSVNQCERNHPHINASKTKGDGDQPPVEDTTDHSGEHPGFGHRDGGKV